MISVVIPLFNKKHTIKKTLESVLLQTFKDFEIIIVDDGSTDFGVDYIKRFTSDSRIIIVQQPNLGVSVARNKGVDISKSGQCLLDCLISIIDVNLSHAYTGNSRKTGVYFFKGFQS